MSKAAQAHISESLVSLLERLAMDASVGHLARRALAQFLAEGRLSQVSSFLADCIFGDLPDGDDRDEAMRLNGLIHEASRR